MDEEFLTATEVAELLKLNRQTVVYNLVERGELPPSVGSRRVRILRSDLDAFLEERRRLSSHSDARLAFDAALETAAKAIRGKDRSSAAFLLRSLSSAALDLARGARER